MEIKYFLRDCDLFLFQRPYSNSVRIKVFIFSVISQKKNQKRHFCFDLGFWFTVYYLNNSWLDCWEMENIDLSLPDWRDCLLSIFAFVDLKTIGRLQQVCNFWWEICQVSFKNNYMT